MQVDEITTKEKLLIYLDRHNTVKTRLVKPLIEKCEKILGDSPKTADFIIKHDFFQKFDKVIEVLLSGDREELRNSIIKSALKNKNILLLCELDKRVELSNQTILKLFKQNLQIDELITCLKISPVYSRVYENAIQYLQSIDLTDKELLFLVQSLNQLLYGQNSIIMSLYYQELNADLIFNSGWPVKTKKSKNLEELRDYIIEKGFKQISNPFLLHFLIDLVLPGYQKKVNRIYNLNPKQKQWLLHERKFKNELNSEIFLFHQFEAIDKSEYGNFEEIWKHYRNAGSLGELNLWFNAVKLYVFRVHFEGLKNDIDYKELLSNKLTSHYLKGLHDLSVIENIPLMSETFDWPSFRDVKRYLKLFDADLNEISPLGYIGYSVGKSSTLTKNKRRTILRKAFLEEDFEELKEYDWGEKQSPKRLEAIARHIASLIRNFRRQDSKNYNAAIQDWKEDLDYLKSEFYDDKYADEFVWVKV